MQWSHVARFAAAAAKEKQKHLIASTKKDGKILDFGLMLMLYAQQRASRPALFGSVVLYTGD